MVPVMKDLQIAYSGVDQTIKDPKERTRKYEEMNSFVMQKNEMNRQQFYDSYHWYEAHPVLLDSILKLVVRGISEDLSTM